MGVFDQSEIVINDYIHIPLAEVEWAFVRSGGPGGQHVNKTSTQAELRFDLANSPSFNAFDREWLFRRLATKLDSKGVLIVRAQEYRSQLRNRNAAIERLTSMLQEAIRRPKPRLRTKPTKSAVERRLESKRKLSDIKKNRRGGFE